MIEALAISAILETGTGQWRKMEVTGYSHGCTNPRSGKEPRRPQKTASHKEAEVNWSVAASEEFPYGTVLQLSYRGIVTTRIVHDRGPDIVNGRLDLFMESCGHAKRWGRRWIWVRELRRPLAKTNETKK